MSDAGPSLWPEPTWITRAADEFGYDWARVAWESAASVPGAWFDAGKADRVVANWPEWFRLTVGRFAGKKFRLIFWQEVVVRLLVGWKAPYEIVDEDTGKKATVHARLFRELRLWMPRKNGKSEFLAALSLLFWALEGLQRGEGYVFARNEDQARIVFTKMADMVQAAPAFAGVQILADALWIQELRSGFQVMTGKAAGKHGRAPTVTAGDEMHEWISRDLADTLRQGEGTSVEPIRLYASTAGLKSQMTGYTLWEESLRVVRRQRHDPQKLIVIFAASKDADPTDEAQWPKANPSLGLSPTIASLREDLAEARESRTLMAAFRRYRLNQWVEDLEQWLRLDKWDLCATRPDGWKHWWQSTELDGRSCYLAFDSTKNFDFASLCLRFDPVEPGEKPKFLWRAFLPSETIAKRTKSQDVPFDRWAEAGLITSVPGGVFDLAYAIAATKECHNRFKIARIGWDSWNALDYYNTLVNDGLPEDLFVEMRFGTKTLGTASRSLERRHINGDLDHGGDPLARWMASHCHVRFDENMNFVPAKKRSGDSIDHIMTAAMCEAMAIAEPPRVDLDSWLQNPVMVG